MLLCGRLKRESRSGQDYKSWRVFTTLAGITMAQIFNGMEDSTLYLVVVATGAVVAHYLMRKLYLCSKVPLPPGPPSYPIVGQLLSMPKEREHLRFLDISRAVRSDVISLSFLGTTIVALNSAEAASELFEKRANIYSDRFAPPMIVSPVGLALHNMMTLMNPNELWKRNRKVMHSWMNKQAVASFTESQQHQARLLLQKLLQCSGNPGSSETIDGHFNHTMAATMLDSVYGYTLESTNDEFVKNASVFINRLSQAFQPSNFLFNLMPWLAHVPEWFPGAGWKKVARHWREHKERTIEGIYQWTKTRAADDYSIISSTLQYVKAWGWDEAAVDDFAKTMGLVLYMGGTDTSVSALQVFTLAMILFPEAQAKAQKEIDSVIGSNRLPKMNDRAHLPYVERLISEILRWQPVSPVGVPHTSAQEDIYCGYRIPKGTIVFGNLWAMSRDERVYSDPEKFDPDRFLNPTVPTLPAFGWGRRLCPGIHLGDASLFIVIASVLAAFDISSPEDKNGNKVLPSTEAGVNGLVYHPKPFQCVLTPRSELHAELIRNGI